MKKEFPEIYKKDATGKIRTWKMELDGDRYRTISGVQGGKLVASKWTVAKGKNAGKANATTPEEQAHSVIESQYKKKLSVDYHENVDNIETVKTFAPMLAAEWTKRKDKITWVEGTMIQPKLDGIRCIASVDGLFSRTGKPIVAVPHIMEELKDFFKTHPDIVLDGELYNHDLKHDFNQIVSLVRKTKPTKKDLVETSKMVEYHIYDIADGNVSEKPFNERFSTLNDLFIVSDYTMNKLLLVDAVAISSEEECDTNHCNYLAKGYEGSIIRLPESYTKGKRSNALIKRKDFDDAEFKVIGYEEGQGNFSGLPKVILIELEDKSKAKATMTGSREKLQELKDNFDDYIGTVATVQFFGRTPDGQLRFPIVKIIHRDKRW